MGERLVWCGRTERKNDFIILYNIPKKKSRLREKFSAGTCGAAHYRFLTARIVSAYPDGDVGCNKGETPLVVSPLSPAGKFTLSGGGWRRFEYRPLTERFVSAYHDGKDRIRNFALCEARGGATRPSTCGGTVPPPFFRC
jgi:hypothetical protein